LADTPSSARTRSWGATDLLMLGAVIIWGINFTVVKLAIQDFSPMAFNALRFGLATVVMLVILGWRARPSGDHEPLGVARADIPAMILLGLLGHTIYQLIFIHGLARTTPANSSLLMATSPIWVVVIGYLLRIERVNRRMWAGILLSFCGIIVLVAGGEGGVSLGGSVLVGDLMILSCAIMWAVWTTGSKPLLARYSPLKLTAWSMATGGVPLVAISVPALLRQDWSKVTVWDWGMVLFSGLLSVVVGYLIWYTSVHRVGNARTAIYSNLTPVVAILFAWAVMGSAPALLQILGGAIVLAGLILTRKERTR
jgi:drug/metabolite transporter (DMT)-like permease